MLLTVHNVADLLYIMLLTVHNVADLLYIMLLTVPQFLQNPYREVALFLSAYIKLHFLVYSKNKQQMLKALYCVTDHTICCLIITRIFNSTQI